MLIAEESRCMQERLISMLEASTRWQLVRNSQEAVDKMKDHIRRGRGFDLVIMDIMMPFKEGCSVVREVREFEKRNGVHPREKTKILFVATLDDPDDLLLNQIRCGADGYMIRPFGRSTLLKAINSLGLETVQGGEDGSDR